MDLWPTHFTRVMPSHDPWSCTVISCRQLSPRKLSIDKIDNLALFYFASHMPARPWGWWECGAGCVFPRYQYGYQEAASLRSKRCSTIKSLFAYLWNFDVFILYGRVRSRSNLLHFAYLCTSHEVLNSSAVSDSADKSIDEAEDEAERWRWWRWWRWWK